jgi:hypothetical protein
MLKPLIKECIKEVIFEEGALSTIISEVMKGTSGAQPIVESKARQQPKQNFERQERKMDEAKQRRKKLLDSIGTDAYNGVNLFEGTTAAPGQSQQGQGPLDGVSAVDPGVDITSLFSGHSSKIWQKLSGKD